MGTYPGRLQRGQRVVFTIHIHVGGLTFALEGDEGTVLSYWQVVDSYTVLNDDRRELPQCMEFFNCRAKDIKPQNE